MKRTYTIATLGMTVLGLALAALPAAAATQLVNLRARVEARREGRAPQYYGIKPSEAVPLAVGETIRVELVGTTAGGADVPVDAAFSQVTARTSIALGRTGPNWVEVKGTANWANGVAQMAYKVTDRRYAMRGGFTEGRVTFQMGGNAPTAGPGNDDVRLHASREIARTLYRTLLGDDLQSQRAQDDVQAIYRSGYSGIQRVAVELAREAEARHVFAGQPPAHVVGELYRGLLKRTGSDRDLLAEDGGFRGAIEAMRRNGFAWEVQTIVGSAEFQTVHGLQGSGLS